MGSSVPLWGAAGIALAEFSRIIEKDLAEDSNEKGSLSVVLEKSQDDEGWKLKNKFSSRIPNGVALLGAGILDRIEIFLVSGNLAVVQYHLQPDSKSCVTIPLGYLTTNQVKIEKIANLLISRYKRSTGYQVLWGKEEKEIEKIFNNIFLETASEYLEANVSESEAAKPNRPLISLKRPRSQVGVRLDWKFFVLL